jgi:hypothetical protein
MCSEWKSFKTFGFFGLSVLLPLPFNPNSIKLAGVLGVEIAGRVLA